MAWIRGSYTCRVVLDHLPRLPSVQVVRASAAGFSCLFHQSQALSVLLQRHHPGVVAQIAFKTLRLPRFPRRMCSCDVCSSVNLCAQMIATWRGFLNDDLPSCLMSVWTLRCWRM